MPRLQLDPKWRTSDSSVEIYHGDASGVLEQMPTGSVHCVVTSPPYWGLRDYNTAQWTGGDPSCDHIETAATDALNAAVAKGYTGVRYKDVCQKCGARRGVDYQIGMEPSPDCGTQGQAQCGRCFVCSLVKVFRSLWRVLRDDGILWLNLGDTYSGGGGYCPTSPSNQAGSLQAKGNRKGVRNIKGNYHAVPPDKKRRGGTVFESSVRKETGVVAGNLCGVPWRVALALQSDGWILRSDIPWVKRACTPESMSTRPTKALEYVFMFVKQMDYFYDQTAIRREATPCEVTITRKMMGAGQCAGMGMVPTGNSVVGTVVRTGDTRNFWNADLWFDSVDKPHGLTGSGDEMVGLDITRQGYSGAHFATFPTGLIEPLIKVGTSEVGCCSRCGRQWERVTEVVREGVRAPEERRGNRDRSLPGNNNGSTGSLDGVFHSERTVGWKAGCTCKADTVPSVVLDPFMGSGTTATVALKLGRKSMGIELSEEYIDLHIARRVNEALKEVPYGASRCGEKIYEIDPIPLENDSEVF